VSRGRLPSYHHKLLFAPATLSRSANFGGHRWRYSHVARPAGDLYRLLDMQQGLVELGVFVVRRALAASELQTAAGDEAGIGGRVPNGRAMSAEMSAAATYTPTGSPGGVPPFEQHTCQPQASAATSSM
jgi:hypothetical protein